MSYITQVNPVLLAHLVNKDSEDNPDSQDSPVQQDHQVKPVFPDNQVCLDHRAYRDCEGNVVQQEKQELLVRLELPGRLVHLVYGDQLDQLV